MNIQQIKERPQQFAQKTSSLSEIGVGLTQVMNNVAQQLIVKNDQNNQIKVNDTLQKAFTDIQIQTADYKKFNTQDPNNEKAYNSYTGSINLIGEKYADTLPTGYKNEFLSKFKGIVSNNDNQLKLWKYDQTNKNNQANIEGQITALNKQAYIYGSNGALHDAITNFETSSGILKDNSKILLGDAVTNELSKNMVKDYYTNYLNGVLATKPENIPAILENEQIKNVVGAEVSDKLLNASIGKIKNLENFNQWKEIAGLVSNNREMTEQVLAGNVDYITLENYLNQNKVSKNTRDYLMKQAGYQVGDGDGTGTNKKTKVSIEDKYNANNLILKDLSKIAIDPTKIEKDTLQIMQDKIYDYSNKGYLTQEETRRYLDKLEEYNGDILKNETLEKYSLTRIGTDIGQEQIEKFIDDNSKLLGYYAKDSKGNVKEEDGKYQVKSTMQKEFTTMQNALYSQYMQNANEEIINYANSKGVYLQDSQGQFSLNSPKDIQRFKNSLSKNELSNIYKTAVNRTMKEYATNIGIDTTDKTPTQITQEVQGQVYKKLNESNNQIIDEIVNKKLNNQSNINFIQSLYNK